MIPSYICFCDNFCCFSYSMNSLVFLTVFPDCRKGDNNLERYFVKLYVAVLGKSLIPSQNLPWQDYVIYYFLYSCSDSFDLIFRIVRCTFDSNDVVRSFVVCINWLDITKTYIFQFNYYNPLLQYLCLFLVLR